MGWPGKARPRYREDEPRRYNKDIQNIKTEEREQMTLVEWLELEKARKRVKRFCACPNNMFTRSLGLRVKHKKLGVRKGFPDLVIIINKTCLFIEMKRPPWNTLSRGKLGPDQLAWNKDLRQCNKVMAAICYGYDEAHDLIKNLQTNNKTMDEANMVSGEEKELEPIKVRIKHTITEEDLAANPGLEEDVQIGDEVILTLTETETELTEEEDPEVEAKLEDLDDKDSEDDDPEDE